MLYGANYLYWAVYYPVCYFCYLLASGLKFFLEFLLFIYNLFEIGLADSIVACSDGIWEMAALCDPREFKSIPLIWD